MSAWIQVICFIYSFIYGIILCLVGMVCRCIRYKILKIIINVMVVFLLSILYMYLLYKINLGMLHEYFILTLLVGYVICRVKICKLVGKVK